MFEIIYNQAFEAEQQNLDQITGMGYRKALEFLIKDFAKQRNPNDATKIEKIMLGDCIKKYITNERLKNAAQKAAWLGNDETHYIRKWIDKDIKDLKILIEMSVHFVSMELHSDQFDIDMAVGKV